MTNSEKAQKEWEAVLQWAVDEAARVRERLKKEGKYRSGLDTNSEYYTYIYQEMDKRAKEIKEKYDLAKENK